MATATGIAVITYETHLMGGYVRRCGAASAEVTLLDPEAKTQIGTAEFIPDDDSVRLCTPQVNELQNDGVGYSARSYDRDVTRFAADRLGSDNSVGSVGYVDQDGTFHEVDNAAKYQRDFKAARRPGNAWFDTAGMYYYVLATEGTGAVINRVDLDENQTTTLGDARTFDVGPDGTPVAAVAGKPCITQGYWVGSDRKALGGKGISIGYADQVDASLVCSSIGSSSGEDILTIEEKARSVDTIASTPSGDRIAFISYLDPEKDPSLYVMPAVPNSTPTKVWDGPRGAIVVVSEWRVGTGK